MVVSSVVSYKIAIYGFISSTFVLTFNKDGVIRPIEEDRVDAALLNVRIEDAFGGILKGEADSILHEAGSNLLEGSVGFFFIKHVDAVNGGDAREHEESIIFCKWKQIY